MMLYPFRKILLASLTFLILCFGAVTTTQATTINFDVDANGNPITAPCCFNQTTPLTNLYASLGVTFVPGSNVGGSILNQSGGFGVNARSGQNFLAINDFSGEGIIFSSPISAFSIYVSGGDIPSAYLLQTFDSNNLLLGTSTVATAEGMYGLLSFTSIPGTSISKILLRETLGNGSFVFDDLNFTPANGQPPSTIPEPATMTLLITGLAGIAVKVRSRRKLKENK